MLWVQWNASAENLFTMKGHDPGGLCTIHMGRKVMLTQTENIYTQVKQGDQGSWACRNGGRAAYSLPRKIKSPNLSKNIDTKHRDRKATKLPPYFALSLQAELNGWSSTSTTRLLLRQVIHTQLQCSKPPTTQTERHTASQWYSRKYCRTCK